MVTTIVLANTSITLHNYHLFSVMRTFKIYSLSNFQVYNTVLLTIITMLFIRSPELIHLITGSLYPLTNISPFVFMNSCFVLFCFFMNSDLIVFLYKFILFLAALGLRCYTRAFLWLRWAGATLCCGVQASHCGGFSGAQALGTRASVVAGHGLSSCGSWAVERRLSSCGVQA